MVAGVLGNKIKLGIVMYARRLISRLTREGLHDDVMDRYINDVIRPLVLII